MLERYIDFLTGVLDRCAECEGLPIMKPYNSTSDIVVECDVCGQLVGPASCNGLAMVGWNKEQRRIEKERNDS